MYKSCYSIVPLKDVFKHITNGFDFRDYQVAGTPYIKVANVKPGYFDFSNLNYIDLNTNDIIKKIQLKRGNLLLTRKGTFGNALSIDVDYDYIISSEVFYLELHKNIVNSKYLEIVLNSNIGQEQFDRFKIGAIMGSLSQEAIKYIKVPLPPKEIQQEVVNIYNAAYQQKQTKEAEAKKLLASIDDYLLAELGITLPEQDNSLQKRTFITNFNKLTGSRFDCCFNSMYFAELSLALYKSKFSISSLGDLLTFIESGSRPSGGVANISDGVLSIGGEHVNDLCEIEVKKPKYIPCEFHLQISKTTVKQDDILLVKDGATTGKIGILDNKRYVGANINEHVFLIRVNSLVSQHYLAYFLHSLIGQQQIQRFITGATVTGLTKDAVKLIELPLPPLEKQQEIAEHIRTIRQKAKQLQEDGASILADAKIQVEQMILGN